MSRILLTHSPDTLANYYGERALAGLKALGEVIANPDRQPLEGESLIRAAAGCDLIVSYRQSPGPAALFERLPKLVAFVRCAIDIRNVDVAAASRSGVLVTQASAGFVTSVAELVFGLMIDLSRRITPHASSYHARKIPRAVMGTDLLRESDFVVPLAVATAETENLIGERELQGMKRTAFLVNASRGNLVDEAALERALDDKWIAGCAMDVGRAPDQMPTPALAARADVIATPHTAGLTLPAIEHQSMETLAQAAEILKGRAPRGAVNAERWTRKALLRK